MSGLCSCLICTSRDIACRKTNFIPLNRCTAAFIVMFASNFYYLAARFRPVVVAFVRFHDNAWLPPFEWGAEAGGSATQQAERLSGRRNLFNNKSERSLAHGFVCRRLWRQLSLSSFECCYKLTWDLHSECSFQATQFATPSARKEIFWYCSVICIDHYSRQLCIIKCTQSSQSIYHWRSDKRIVRIVTTFRYNLEHFWLNKTLF
jgi:hypothetical protein